MSHYLKDELYHAIQSSQQLFDFIQEAALDGLWYWDLESPEHEWLSPKFWQVLGYDPATKKHLASEWQDLIHPEDLASAIDNFEKHLADANHPYDQVVRYQHKAGHTIWVRCRGLAIRDASGKPTRMLGAHNDITQLKNSEAKLEQASRVKSQFLANMSHGLKTPLNGILGMAQLAQQQTDLDGIQGKLKKIENAGQQLLAKVNDLLLFNKLEAGLVTRHAQPFLLQSVLNDLQREFQEIAQRKGLKWVVQNNVTSPQTTLGDPELLKQVLSKLIDNAIRFTEYGEVRVSVQSAFQDRGLLEFLVADTGCGIAEEARQTLFKPFSQIDDTHTREHQGVGLSLAICERLIDVMEGEPIECQSQLGQGTQFRFRLPLARPTQDLSIETVRVLIIDENYINRELAAELIRQIGYEVDSVEDNKQASNKLKSGEYQCVFINYFYQKSDGFSQLIQWHQQFSIKVIAMLTVNDASLRNSLPTSIDGTVSMPLSVKKLQQVLSENLAHFDG